jgi:tetratricopeptide (TPR) repeat protein
MTSPTDPVQQIRQAVSRQAYTDAAPAFRAISRDAALIRQERVLIKELALGLFGQGRYRESLPVFVALLSTGDTDVGTAVRYGQALAYGGHPDQAANVAEQILGKVPGHQGALLLRAECFAMQCRDDQIDHAMALFEVARAVSSQGAESHRPRLKLARWLRSRGRIDQAMALAIELAALVPEDAEIESELAECHSAKNQLVEAKRHRERSLLMRQPAPAEWITHYGNVLFRMGEAASALLVCQLSRTLDPTSPRTLYELASIAFRCEQMDLALPALEEALRLHAGDWPDGGFARGLMLLMAGHLESGWHHYENRLRCQKMKVPDPLKDQWDGSPLQGTLHVYTEQGLGDSVMFSRFLPKVREKAGPEARIVFVLEKSLLRLMETSFAGVVDEFLVPTEAPVAAPAAQIATGSLPKALGVKSEDDLRASRRYLRTPERLRIPLKPGRGKFHVGVCWSGNSRHLDHAYRIIPLDQVMPLFDIPGVQFHSLHIGEPCTAIKEAGKPSNLSLYDEQIDDLADTAQVIDQCDMVVSVDTSGIHLAGALGKPALLLLPRGSEFRWMLGRADTPWYESVEILRQRHFHDWAEVIERAKVRIIAEKDASTPPPLPPVAEAPAKKKKNYQTVRKRK